MEAGNKKLSEDPVEVSIVIPVFNEEESLPELASGIRKVMKQWGRTYRMIFVDDGSTDGSIEVLEKIHAESDDLQVISFLKNCGKSAALNVGFSHATGRYVVTMDGDLQDDPKEIPALISRLEGGYDLVSGWKKRRKDPLSKRLPSCVFNAVTAWASGIKIHDFNCGLKAYRKEVTEHIDIYGELHRYIPFLAGQAGFRVTEIPVLHHRRRYGRSKFGLWRFFSGFFDFLTVLILTKFTMRPLHFFGSIGLVLFLCGMIINTYMLSLRIRFGNIQGRQPLFMGGILLAITGIQFFFTGFLAEIITSFRKDRPKRYLIRKHLG